MKLMTLISSLFASLRYNFKPYFFLNNAGIDAFTMYQKCMQVGNNLPLSFDRNWGTIARHYINTTFFNMSSGSDKYEVIRYFKSRNKYNLLDKF